MSAFAWMIAKGPWQKRIIPNRIVINNTFEFCCLLKTHNLLLSNEMKRYDVVLEFKVDYRSQKILRFLKIEGSFVDEVLKKLEKENDKVTLLSKRKRGFFIMSFH